MNQVTVVKFTASSKVSAVGLAAGKASDL